MLCFSEAKKGRDQNSDSGALNPANLLQGPGYRHLVSIFLYLSIITPGPGSLDKKGGRKIPSMLHLCLIKDGTVFPLFCLTIPAQFPEIFSQALILKDSLRKIFYAFIGTIGKLQFFYTFFYLMHFTF
jgi:hypothetical protein